MGNCVIFGAAEFDTLLTPLGADDLVIAADGGYAHTRSLGILPDVILGDFDSLGFVPEGAEVFPVEKDDTDTMLAVRLGLARGYRDFLLYGSMDGPRLDHTLAAYQTLQFLADRDARGILVGKDFLATAVREQSLVFDTEVTATVSVFCMGADARGVTLEGLGYPLENGTLTPGFPLGVSNALTGRPGRIRVEQGSLLVLWEQKAGIPRREG